MRVNKNGLMLFLFLLAGIVAGGAAAYYFGDMPYLSWLKFGQSFGFSEPVDLDMVVVALKFALVVRLNIASIIGMALAYLIYRRV